MTGLPTGAQQHALGHIALPENHGFAERVHVQTLDCAQVSRGANSVRPCTDNRDVTPCHWFAPVRNRVDCCWNDLLVLRNALEKCEFILRRKSLRMRNLLKLL